MRISLRQLAVFEAVARYESVSRGADDVALSQSAASMALKELEEGLGIILFHRHGRKLTLNENGRRLQPMARSLLAQAHEIERITQCDELTGILRIAATETIADHVLGPICARFLRENPAVQIKLRPTSWQDVLDQVESMSCDLGFADSPCGRASLIFEPILSDELVIFAAAGHPLAHGRPIDARELATERWCLRAAGSSTRHKLTLGLASFTASISVAFESNSNQAIKAAVREGLGLGCLSRRAVEAEFAASQLVPLDVTGLALGRVFGLLRPRNVYRGVLQDSFAALVLSLVEPDVAARFKLPEPAIGSADDPRLSSEPISRISHMTLGAPVPAN